MALRAGYYGLKISVIRSITSFARLGITKLGTMFNVASDGELIVRNATKTIPGLVKLDDVEKKINYTAEEQNTGIKWLDGREIYQKTINFGSLPNNDIKIVPHGVDDIDIGWIYDGFAKSSTSDIGFTNMLSLCAPTDLTLGWYTALTDDNIEIRTGTNRSAYNAFVTIRYVKKLEEV